MSTTNHQNPLTQPPSPLRRGAGGEALAVLHLPTGLALLAERQIARQQELNTKLHALEPQLAANLTPAVQLQWDAGVNELAGINDLLELLQVPVVRLIAMKQQRARHEAFLSASRTAAQRKALKRARCN